VWFGSPGLLAIVLLWRWIVFIYRRWSESRFYRGVILCGRVRSSSRDGRRGVIPGGGKEVNYKEAPKTRSAGESKCTQPVSSRLVSLGGGMRRDGEAVGKLQLPWDTG